ncbi:MAG TPA: hypothetical protein VJR89_30340 [Polyangiales bacterium]|nr:hypothetical protein [Polyangiales bacterium]
MRRVRVLSAALVLSFSGCQVDFHEKGARSDDEEESPDAASGDSPDDDSKPTASGGKGGSDSSSSAGKSGSSAAGSGGRGGTGGAAGAGSTSTTAVSADAANDDSSAVCATAAALAAAVPLNAGVKRLSGVLKVTGDARVNGEVTIDPGTTIIMGADSSIEFGWNDNRTTLTALGTKDKPIRFCSDKSGVGRWHSVLLTSGLTSDSALENVHIYDAGSRNAALTLGAPVRLVDVTIHGSKNDGVLASTFGDDSHGLNIRNTGRAAAVLTNPIAVTKFPKTPTFANIGENSVRLSYDRIVDVTVKFAKLPSPYLQELNTRGVGTASLEFDAGVEYLFATDAGLEVGWNDSPGVIKVNGTAAEPVVFRGVNEGQGSWQGLIVGRYTSSDSTLSNLQILDAGFSRPALEIHRTMTLQDVLVKNCKTSPLIDVPLNPASKNLTVTGCAAHALNTLITAVPALPKGGKFTGNGQDMIRMPDQNSAPTGTIPNLGVPYYVTGLLKLGAGTDLTLEPGTEFMFVSGVPAGLQIGWNGSRAKFVAQGSPSAPIIFRGEKEGVGTWSGVQLESYVSTDSKFDHVQVRNAGLITDATITITNSSFSDSSEFGILKRANNMTDYKASNVFSNNAKGDVGMQ